MHCKNYSHFFSKKFRHICISLDVNFNESLTNDIISFEQLGPDIFLISPRKHIVGNMFSFYWGASNEYFVEKYLSGCFSYLEPISICLSGDVFKKYWLRGPYHKVLLGARLLFSVWTVRLPIPIHVNRENMVECIWAYLNNYYIT